MMRAHQKATPAVCVPGKHGLILPIEVLGLPGSTVSAVSIGSRSDARPSPFRGNVSWGMDDPHLQGMVRAGCSPASVTAGIPCPHPHRGTALRVLHSPLDEDPMSGSRRLPCISRPQVRPVKIEPQGKTLSGSDNDADGGIGFPRPHLAGH